MTVGALLDLGADKEKLVRALEASGIGGYHLHFGRTKKCGIDAYDFDVHLEGEEAEHAHSHHRHETAHDQTEEAAHGHHHHHGGHGHEECGHEEHRHEEHGHGEHGHIHRNLNDVKEIDQHLFQRYEAAGCPDPGNLRRDPILVLRRDF